MERKRLKNILYFFFSITEFLENWLEFFYLLTCISNRFDLFFSLFAAPACTDSDKRCSAWAKIGECTKNPLWMGPNCRKSCKQCWIKFWFSFKFLSVLILLRSIYFLLELKILGGKVNAVDWNHKGIYNLNTDVYHVTFSKNDWIVSPLQDLTLWFTSLKINI